MAAETHRVVGDGPTSNDKLGFRAYKDSLVRVIRSADTPITIGIFGAWGSGKTSLMRMVQHDLPGATYKVRSVWFNAWKYDKRDALWRALLVEAIEALRQKSEDTEDDTKANKPLDDVLASLYRDVDREEASGVQIDWGNVAKGSLRLGVSMIPAFSELSKLIPGMSSKTDPDKTAIDALVAAFGRERTKIHRDQVRFLDQFEGEFRKLVTEKLQPGENLVFFIDDLDRCLPEKAVEVLEAIKLFLDVERCVFVVGVERKIVEKGIRVKYQSLGFLDTKEDLPIDGDEYLEKIIQIPFHLPRLYEDNIRTFIETSLKDEGFNETVADVFAVGMQPNPRKLKRVMNVFRLLTTLAQERRKDAGKEARTSFEVKDELLAKVVVIQTRWRDSLFEEVERRPLLLGILEERFETGIADGSARAEIESTGARGKSQRDPAEQQDPGERTGLSEEQAASGTAAGSRAKRQETIERRFLVEDEFNDLEQLLGAGTEHFRGMTEDELRPYIFLTSAVAEEGAEDAEKARPRTRGTGRVDERLWEELVSSDPTRVQTAAGRLERGQQSVYIERLLQIVQDQQQHDLPTRIGAGNALGALGDPRIKTLAPAMITIPQGTFTMGDDESGEDDEKPAHPVILDAFEIAKYPLTNQEYKVFLDSFGQTSDQDRSPRDWAQGRYPTGKANHPVVGVSWEDVTAYGEWLSEATGSEYRLPSEAQWERAARGAGGRRYPWSDDFDADNCNTSDAGVGATTPVGIFPLGASSEGVLDMSGNVWEWCQDWYVESYYKTVAKAGPANNPTGPASGSFRVVRGGSFLSFSSFARCTFRDGFTPVFRVYDLGVRFSRTLALTS